AMSVLARDKDTGRLIGHVAGVPIDLKVGRFLRKVFLTVDSAVDPSHQGRGIHAALSMQISDRTDEVEAGFALGLPNEQAYVPMLKLGTTHILTMSLYLKVLDWSRLIQAKFPSNGLTRFAVRLIHPFQRKRKTNVRAFDGPSLQEVHNFGPEVDALWNRIEAQFGICARRTSTILNWRYFDRPNSLYRAFSISSGGQ